MAAFLEDACAPWFRSEVIAPSLLTASGCPIEVSIRPGGSALTLEPGLPDASMARKWARAERFSGLFRDAHPVIAELSQHSGQLYGCWLGARENGSTLNFKIYQEVAPCLAAAESVRNRLRQLLPAHTPFAQLLPRIVAFESGADEYYCRITGARPATIHRLLAAAGVDSGARGACLGLAAIAGRPLDVLFAQIPIGISYKFQTAASPSVTLFLHAASLSADFAVIRRRLQSQSPGDWPTTAKHGHPVNDGHTLIWNTLSFGVNSARIVIGASIAIA